MYVLYVCMDVCSLGSGENNNNNNNNNDNQSGSLIGCI